MQYLSILFIILTVLTPAAAFYLIEHSGQIILYLYITYGIATAINLILFFYFLDLNLRNLAKLRFDKTLFRFPLVIKLVAKRAAILFIVFYACVPDYNSNIFALYLLALLYSLTVNTFEEFCVKDIHEEC